MPTIYDALDCHLPSPLVEITIGYERLPGCLCFTYEGDLDKYTHYLDCRYRGGCYECHTPRPASYRMRMTHEPTCSALLPQNLNESRRR
jgi:hypothetical protein